jgi:alkylation response protein AidB-like acyl-CoA dehydrogenase
MVFTDEQQEFAASIRSFCARECGTREQRAALTEGFTVANSHAMLARLGEMGWLGVSVPAEYGGAGAGMVEECIFLEETCRGHAPVHGYSTALTAGQTYMRWGTPEQNREVMGGICRGRLEAIALSEPGAGSDLGSARCAARREGDEYVINGQKTWISVAHEAGHLLTFARTDGGGAKHDGLTFLMVPTDTPGLEIREIEVMTPRVVNDVFYTDVRVPAANVVGTEGRAWSQLMRGLAIERLIIAVMAVGYAARSLDDTIAYLKEREQFGRPLSTFQALRHRVADVATEIACCRALVYDIAQKIDAGHEDALSTASSMAKMKCTETAKLAALEGMQLMGGYGYAVEYGMEEQVRQALVPPIYGGTNEIQREIISKNLGL